MKSFLSIIIILAILLLCCPLLAIEDKNEILKETSYEDNNILTLTEESNDSFRVLIADTGEIKNMSAEDYIFGVVAAEMPALYEKEALKAQAVAAYSFALRRKAAAKNKNYDISTDFTVDQSFVSEEEIKAKWGEKAEEYSNKIHSAVKEVKGMAVYYKDEVALTPYHAISCGATESSKEIWGGSYSYLVSVDSVWDKLAKNYLSSESFSSEEIKSKLGNGYTYNGNCAEWISITKKTKFGSVKKVKVCGKEISGEDLRKVLGLRSLNFTVEYKNSNFIFTVKGYGHGVGMSQNGADYMAKQGSGYKEILEYYYSGCKVKTVTK